MKDQCYQYMDWPRIEAIVYGEEAAPRDVLAPRATEQGVLVQGFFPGAQSAEVWVREKCFPMVQEDEAGYFAAMLPYKRIPAYRFRVTKDGETTECQDPYRYACPISELDEKRFLAGIHYEIYEKLGAHPMEISGVKGTAFAVWAPNALRVSVVGDFNNWDGRCHPMHRMPASGIFQLFLPQVEPGALYKYEIKTRSGQVFLKADPYGNQMEALPGSASKVCSLEGYEWKDEAWRKAGGSGASGQPFSVFEANLADWEGEEGATYQELGKKLAAYGKEMGYTHVELSPVMEYRENPSNTRNYYAPTARYGSGQDFMEMVDLLHQAGIGVLMVWTAAAFPDEEEGLREFDGTLLYENEDIRKKYHPIWNTLLYNYDSPLVRNFLIANAFFWMRVYHLDGLRMDDVDTMLYLDCGRKEGEWAPNLYGSNENLAAVDFLKHLHSMVKKENPGFLFVAKEEGMWPDLTGEVDDTHMGFDYKWNRGFSRDFLSYLQSDFWKRARLHDVLTFSMVYAYSERYLLTLGSQDVGSAAEFLSLLPGDEAQKEAGLREALAYQICHPGGKLQLDLRDMPEGIRACGAAALELYRSCPALHELDEESEGFEWIQLMKAEENIVTFLRKTKKKEETLLAVFNFSPRDYEDYAVGVPWPGKYKEIFNSEDVSFGGSGVGNPRVKMSRKKEWDERPDSIRIKVPALGCCIFRYSQVVEKVDGNQAAKARAQAKRKTK